MTPRTAQGALRRLALTLAAAFALACTGPEVVVADPEPMLRDRLQFLQDGRTTREEVLHALDRPYSQFDRGRILVYVFRFDSEGRWILAVPPQREVSIGDSSSWWKVGRPELDPGVCSLVLVFQADGRLERHSLVLAN